MERLPLELLDNVCRSLLKPKPVREFRLVCRRFAEVGLRYLIPAVSVWPDSKSLERLECIANHPRLRHHVVQVRILQIRLEHHWENEADMMHNYSHRAEGCEFDWLTYMEAPVLKLPGKLKYKAFAE